MQLPNRSSTTSCKQKGNNPMPLVKPPSKQPKTTNVQVRLEGEVKHSLDKYAEFLNATPSYVVSEALKLLCRKDKEFQIWLSKHPQETKEANQGAMSLS
jgi:predicted transcriptional regulator